MVGKTADNLTLFQFGGGRAALSLGNQRGKVFFLADVAGNVLAAGIAGSACGVESVSYTHLGLESP